MGMAELQACVQVRKLLQLSRSGFGGVHYLEVKIRGNSALGPRIVSAVQSLEVVASRRLLMYYKYRIFSP